MLNITLKEISNNINGKLIGKDYIINNISINSKKIKENCLFVAFKGNKFDAHIFIEDSINNGAIAILTSKYFNNIKISQIVVNNVNNSFFLIAKFIRKKSKSYIIAITGSCGKTSVKEMTVSILKNIRKTCYTNKNQNNIIGISITLCNIKYYNMFVVVEVGTDNLNQISNLIDILEPNIILINNLYISHFLNFKNYKYLSYAKGEILEKSSKFNRIILNFDNNNWNYWKFITFNKNPIFFSINKLNNVNFYSSNVKLYNLKSKYLLNTPIGKKHIYLKLPGISNIYNSLAASAISISLGSNLNNIQKSLLNFKYLKHRLYPIFLSKYKIILDDTYNSNVGSFISSVNILSNFIGYKVLVISDLLELGNSEIFIHKILGNLVKKFNINKILSLGNLSYFITLNSKLINNISKNFNNKYDLIKEINNLIKNNNKITILIKGSRLSKLDELIKYIIYDNKSIK